MAFCFSFLSISYILLRSSQACKDIIDEKGKDSLLYGFYRKEQHYLSPQVTLSTILRLELIFHITGMNSQQYTKSKVQHHLGVRMTLNDESLFDSLDVFFHFSKAKYVFVTIWYETQLRAQFIKVFELNFLTIIMIISCTTQGPVNHGKESRGWVPSTHASWVIVIT